MPQILEVGRVCKKISGRFAGRLAVIVDEPEGNFVLIDGNLKRKRCNVSHLIPLDTMLKIKRGASTEDIHKAMSAVNLDTIKLKVKTKEKATRLSKKRKTKESKKEPEKRVKEKKAKDKKEKKNAEKK